MLCCKSDNQHERGHYETLQFAANLISEARENHIWFSPCFGFFQYVVLYYHHSVQEQGLGECLKCPNTALSFFVMVFPNGAEPKIACPFLNNKGQG